MEKKYGTVSGYKMYPYGRAKEDFKEDDHPRDNDGKFTSIGATQAEMQGDLIVDGKTATSTGAGYDKWLAKQKNKEKPKQKTDTEREDFFEKARKAREEKSS